MNAEVADEPIEEGSIEIPSLPHVRLNLEERSVDVDAVVCLNDGMLELIACTKGTKEHESILAIEAKARDVHMMLLLLGAKAGSPPRLVPIDEAKTRFRDYPARGSAIDVSLIVTGEDGESTERPISDFIRHKDGDAFPEQAFVFAGSAIVPNPNEEASLYVADQTGHVITLASFGDELLAQAKSASHANEHLTWEVNPEILPDVGEEIILRLRPRALEP
ncbi:YdjY domain-containing protein [Rubellicoccus peritrichatus]|uniref:YdjY domain-containing protein n=1 Tax=Rubellicoccus peritrichatus TaxID=3080537 RepID=A0AAQ3LCI1_9BACT|nr:YdjY domain-containing protein [Puniceicoccus sp. CR14]WOO43281.1 YdjY domain-containing protein [Puniceicoccus sp. CR14]